MDASLTDLVSSLGDTVVDLLEAGETEGWSPTTDDDALSFVDVLCVALAAHGGPLETSLTQVRAHIAAAQRGVRRDLPPAPRRGSVAARAEEQDGTARFRAWRDARVHQWPASPRVRRNHLDA
ncbi:hypothetical protein QC334_34630 [Streptomyces sp. DH18]|uniref:hypothetical protein n=1 Tax=Streptomyces sp. DH18 TaxID=3040126 RepID=UPI00244294B9|nr:hypothetical protein [Streptomyces sp. DH18]MDG9687807.1 hypothetical protein [Streptomyces sp. DH18]